MKNLLITTSLLFAFSGAFAQEKGTKNIKPVKAPSSVRPMSSEVESYKKDNGIAKPIKGSGVNTVKPVKGTSSSVAPSKTTTIRPQKSAAGNSTRAAAGSRVNTMKAEKPSANNTKNNTFEKGEKGNPEAKGERPSSSKFDADYCKGWKDGFSKAYSKGTKEKLESADIPRCENNGKCEGYKCGYEAGMKKAELMLR